MIPDIEKVASDFLRGHPAAGALGTRFVGKTPTHETGGVTDPWVRVIELSAPNRTGARVEHLIGYLVQLEVYASEVGGQPMAKTHARTIRAALHDDLPGVRSGAVVSDVRIVGWMRSPDNAFDPPRERMIITAEIRAHS